MGAPQSILKYSLLPGILPRLFTLFTSGFAHLAYFMAVVYANVRLLPPAHPYLHPANIGRFGLRHVMAEAASQLVFSRKNIDQIVIYFTIMAGILLLFGQFVLLIFAMLATQPALALSATDLFINPNSTTGSLGPDQDIAFILMDNIFGVKGFFDSCISNISVACEDLRGLALPNQVASYPFPFHLAFHQLLAFYSYGIFLVGVFVIIYFVITIVSETAESGTPFGQRFNKAWAPVRVILFFALLIPMNYGGQNDGFNGAQLITFKVVQLGSNFASNAWSYFNGGGSAGLSDGYLSQQKNLVATPNIPEVNNLLQTIYIARTCTVAYHMAYGPEKAIDAYIVRSAPPEGTTPATTGIDALHPDAREFLTSSFDEALDFSVGGNITIRFGRLGEDDGAGNMEDGYSVFKGNVKPYCGDVTIKTDGGTEPGSRFIQEEYYNMLMDIWMDNDFLNEAECIVKTKTSNNNEPKCAPMTTQNSTEDKVAHYTQEVRDIIEVGIDKQRSEGAFDVPPEIIERGWAGAAIWYNRLAAMNGAITTATLNLPRSSKLPALMEAALYSNQQQNKNVPMEDQFKQAMADSTGMNVLFDISEKDRELLSMMSFANDFWIKHGASQNTNFNEPTGNVIIDFINSVLGTSGIFNIRKNTDAHPLAQLSALGKSMMEATIRNMTIATAGTLGEGVLKTLDPFVNEAAKGASGFLFAMVAASIGISATLYYVLPLLPFIYFLFAISGWLKSIFEAIIAMPLWALAHLRIDGEGLPGPGATNGYFLLLEIFLRPILILIGLLASISIFSALVSVLNQIFDLVVVNAGGFDQEVESGIQTGAIADLASKIHVSRGPVDEFFFTAMYAIICYMIGLACFKLVDMIPNNILRWAGVSVSTIQESLGDPAGQLSRNVYRGAQLTTGQITGDVRGNLAMIMTP